MSVYKADEHFQIDPEFKEFFGEVNNEELAILDEQIICENDVEPLTVGVFPDGKKILLDGHLRQAICKRKKIAYRTKERKFKSREEAFLWMARYQGGRRNWSKETRQTVVQKLRDMGKSLRAIAETVGVCASTVLSDLKEAPGVQNRTPDRNDGKTEAKSTNSYDKESKNASVNVTPEEIVTGQDGKTYAASRPRSESSEQILCGRCQRVGARIGCMKCADAKRAMRSGAATSEASGISAPSKPKKAGSVLFDDKKMRDQIGMIGRMVCERQRVYGKSPYGVKMMQSLETTITLFDQWRASERK